MKAIGGYFELEAGRGVSFHKEAVALNTGRNAFEYILQSRRFSKIYIPYYTCKVLQQPLKRLSLPFAYYSIDERFEPVFDYTAIGASEAFLYTNYYGLKDAFIAGPGMAIPNLIVDNAQAFFSKAGIDRGAFYSPRKFFGVPDGGYAYPQVQGDIPLPQDRSAKRFEHLLLRAEADAEAGYPLFTAAEHALDDSPVKAMSVLTQRLLGAVDYDQCASVRRRNYEVLYEALKAHNEIDLPLPEDAVPMVFPFLSRRHHELRSRLIGNRIYVARYWPEVMDICAPETTEYLFADRLIPLPVDQRIAGPELNFIINTITNAY